jgi:hypothetical protein
MKMIVRFEVDACISTPATTPNTPPKPGLDHLASVLSGLSISATNNSPASPSSKNSPVKVIRGGSYIPQEAVVELTTRTEKRQIVDWIENFPQLFLSQTPHHFLGIHRSGRFTTVQKRKLNSPDFSAAERTVQPGLKKLRRALEIIKEIVMESGQRGRLSLVCQGGVLKVFERTSQESCLPQEVMERFDL